jgi:hypothetical protein
LSLTKCGTSEKNQNRRRTADGLLTLKPIPKIPYNWPDMKGPSGSPCFLSAECLFLQNFNFTHPRRAFGDIAKKMGPDGSPLLFELFPRCPHFSVRIDHKVSNAIGPFRIKVFFYTYWILAKISPTTCRRISWHISTKTGILFYFPQSTIFNVYI